MLLELMCWKTGVSRTNSIEFWFIRKQGRTREDKKGGKVELQERGGGDRWEREALMGDKYRYGSAEVRFIMLIGGTP